MPIDSQLSAELQELYLENKEWLSDIIFLEDEMRFFQNLFENGLSAKVKIDQQQQVEVVRASLNQIMIRRKYLKAVLNTRKEQLEQLLAGKMKHIGIEFIEEDTAIVREVHSLMATDKCVKAELFALIEQLKAKDTLFAHPASFKVHRYPIL